MQTHFRYFIINKPFGMESQFISTCEGSLLGDLLFPFPEGTHAIGRLDKYSEGLLLLTTNKKITALLFQSKVPHKRTYLVQVKNKVAAESLARLRNGVCIRIKGGEYYITPPCDVELVPMPTFNYASPVTVHFNQANAWLRITLKEGKFHQVRKMVAATGNRCLRLIRISIEDLLLNDMCPGEVKEIDENEVFQKLDLDRASISTLQPEAVR